MIGSVLTVAVLFTVFTFALEGAVRYNALQAHGDNTLTYIADVLGNTALAKLMIVTVLFSAVGSTLACIVAGGRVTFAMGYDKVLPPVFGRTHPKYKTPVAAMLAGAAIAFGVHVAVCDRLQHTGGVRLRGEQRRPALCPLLRRRRVRGRGLLPAAGRARRAGRSLSWSCSRSPRRCSSAMWFGARSPASAAGPGATWSTSTRCWRWGIALMAYAKIRGESDYFDQPLEAYEPSGGARGGRAVSARACRPRGRAE